MRPNWRMLLLAQRADIQIVVPRDAVDDAVQVLHSALIGISGGSKLCPLR